MNSFLNMLAQGNPTAVATTTAIGSAVIAVLTAIFSFFSTRHLDKERARLQKMLEERKIELLGELEQSKGEIQGELDKSKANIADEASAKTARRGYEYEARKRLYTEVEPLLFALSEAAEGAFHAVASLVRSHRKGKLPSWLVQDGYYLRSITYRLLLPLVILRLLQRSTTLVDLTLDASIGLKYRILKECYLTLTDDFALAAINPKIDYEPNVENWRQARRAAPCKHWRQGYVIGHLDRTIDALIIHEGDKSRPMNYGEMESSLVTSVAFNETLGASRDLIIDFDFCARPVLGRLLIAYAALLHVLMSIYELEEIRDPFHQCMGFFDSKEWDSALALNDSVSPLSDLRPYIERRIRQATRNRGYVKF